MKVKNEVEKNSKKKGKCLVCGSYFDTERKTRKTCSNRCRVVLSRNKVEYPNITAIEFYEREPSNSKTGIEWTQETSNPIRILKDDNSLGGHWCKKISEGCKNCYAETINQSSYFGFASHLPYQDLGDKNPQLTLNENELKKWENARIGKIIFVGDMTDIFGEWVLSDWQDRIFDSASKSKHTFQFLTKRPEIMVGSVTRWCERHNRAFPDNIWLGCSVENQKRVSRVAELVKMRHLVKVLFLSVEPLLSDVNFGFWLNYIDWVIVGGESGKGARECKTEWIESVIAQAKTYQSLIFVKQLGTVTAKENSITKKGGELLELPQKLRYREMPKVIK